ncbi:MAG TPA: DUF169 domain-containing protein [Alloacidobacterium sp.]|nr:DUF169 domain-containing protein [Alloacidobacterium sp.]
MSSYASLADTLTAGLNLSQPPIAISFSESVPEGVQKHDGPVPAGCRFWQDAATTAFVTTSADHALCAIGIYTHNLETSHAQQTDLMDALKIFGQLDYVRQEDLALIPVLQSRQKYVIYAPLAVTPLSPDVVLLFVNAGQMLILSEAAQQVENQNAPAMGRPACAVVPQVMNTGRAALSLGCCGARTYLDVLTDNVALFAIPGVKLGLYAQRIEALAKANATLSQFHQIRRRDIGAGLAPTIQESLQAMQSG